MDGNIVYFHIIASLVIIICVFISKSVVSQSIKSDLCYVVSNSVSG